MPRMKNTIPYAPLLCVCLWHVYDDVTAVEAMQLNRHVNNHAHSKAVLNCSGSANRPEPSRAEPSRTTQWKSAKSSFTVSIRKIVSMAYTCLN